MLQARSMPEFGGNVTRREKSSKSFRENLQNTKLFRALFTFLHAFDPEDLGVDVDFLGDR
jgi:hypothetical protein